MTVGRIYIWETDRAAVCDRIRESSKPLKIVLKTKNDREFLPNWIEHHQRIVGADGLIIFDNESTDEAVLGLYDSLPPGIIVVRFSGFHNFLHRVDKYPDLYASVRASTRHFSFLDTDELMIWASADGHRWCADATLIDELSDLADDHSVPGIWLENLMGSPDTFRLFRSSDPELPIGLRTGKPIIASAVQSDGLVCHNFQYGLRYFTSPAQRANLLVLHLKNLSPAQRIRANLEKLRKYKVLAATQGLEHALAIEPDSLRPSNPRVWLKEIRNMQRALDEGKGEVAAALGAGKICLHPSGDIAFSTDDDRHAFAAFLAEPGLALARALAGC